MARQVRRARVGVLDRPGGAGRRQGWALATATSSIGSAELGVHRHGQPLRAGGGLDAIAVLPAVLLVLHGVEEHEDVGGRPLGEVAEPRQIVRLVDGHGGHGRTKIGLVSTRCWAPRASARQHERRAVGRPRGARRAAAWRPAPGAQPAVADHRHPHVVALPSLASTAMDSSIGVPAGARSVSPTPAVAAPAVTANSATSKPSSRVRWTAYIRPRRSASSTPAVGPLPHEEHRLQRTDLLAGAEPVKARLGQGPRRSASARRARTRRAADPSPPPGRSKRRRVLVHRAERAVPERPQQIVGIRLGQPADPHRPEALLAAVHAPRETTRPRRRRARSTVSISVLVRRQPGGLPGGMTIARERPAAHRRDDPHRAQHAPGSHARRRTTTTAPRPSRCRTAARAAAARRRESAAAPAARRSSDCQPYTPAAGLPSDRQRAQCLRVGHAEDQHVLLRVVHREVERGQRARPVIVRDRPPRRGSAARAAGAPAPRPRAPGTARRVRRASAPRASRASARGTAAGRTRRGAGSSRRAGARRSPADRPGPPGLRARNRRS